MSLHTLAASGLLICTLTSTIAAPGGPPPNDSCGTVASEALNVGATLIFTGDNTGADTVGDAEAGTLLDDYGPDVWHVFTTTECADVTIAFCGTSPLFGNVWNLLATTCPADNNLIYGVGNNTDCLDGNRTTFYNDLPAGTYYLPVLLDPFSSLGAYTILVGAATCVPAVPVNDECGSVTASALNVESSVGFSGDNTGATTTNDAVPGTLLANVGLPNVWHAFTTTECADVTVALCGTSPVFGNVWNLLATTCPADDNLVYGAGNNTDCVDGNRTTFYNDLPAGTYYLPVLVDAFSSSEGPYTITVSATSCVPPLAANDTCGGLVPADLVINGTITFTGDNTNATTTNDAEPGTLLANINLPVVWHAFTTTECLSITVDYCTTAPAFTNTYNLLVTTCPANDVLVYSDSSNSVDCGDGNRTIYFHELMPGTYYIPVLMDPFGAQGPYTVTVNSDSCLTTGMEDPGLADWSVFPNPGNGALSIAWGGPSTDLAVELIDLSGRMVHKEVVRMMKGGQHALGLHEHLATGTYLLRLTSSSGTAERRVVVH